MTMEEEWKRLKTSCDTVLEMDIDDFLKLEEEKRNKYMQDLNAMEKICASKRTALEANIDRAKDDEDYQYYKGELEKYENLSENIIQYLDKIEKKESNPSIIKKPR